MSDKQWFSTKLRFAVMVEPGGADTLNDCVFLVRARDFCHAFERALAIGEASQKQYLNDYGKRVRWRLMEVISTDVIRTDQLDGTAIYSEPIHLSQDNVIPFEAQFAPGDSKPIQTI